MCPESSLAPSSASPLCWPTSSHRLHIGRRSPRRGTDGGQVWEVGQVFSANLLVQSDHSVPEPAGGGGEVISFIIRQSGLPGRGQRAVKKFSENVVL